MSSWGERVVLIRYRAVPMEEIVRAFDFVINQGWVGDAANCLTE